MAQAQHEAQSGSPLQSTGSPDELLSTPLSEIGWKVAIVSAPLSPLLDPVELVELPDVDVEAVVSVVPHAGAAPHVEVGAAVLVSAPVLGSDPEPQPSSVTPRSHRRMRPA